MSENRGFPCHRHCRIDHGTAECLTKNDVQTIAYGLSPQADSAIASLSCLTRLYRQTPFPILLPLQPACHPPPRDHAKRSSSEARLTPPGALDMSLSMLSFMRFGRRFKRRQKRLSGLQSGLDLRRFISIIAPRKFGAQRMDIMLDGHS